MIFIAVVVLFMLGPLPIIMGLVSAAKDRHNFTRYDR
jgi:hypothetical protein